VFPAGHRATTFTKSETSTTYRNNIQHHWYKMRASLLVPTTCTGWSSKSPGRMREGLIVDMEVFTRGDPGAQKLVTSFDSIFEITAPMLGIYSARCQEFPHFELKSYRPSRACQADSLPLLCPRTIINRSPGRIGEISLSGAGSQVCSRLHFALAMQVHMQVRLCRVKTGGADAPYVV